MPNIEMETSGGKVFWTDIVNVNGWRVQENSIFQNCRILDPSNVRKAWGGRESMVNAFREIVSEQEK